MYVSINKYISVSNRISWISLFFSRTEQSSENVRWTRLPICRMRSEFPTMLGRQRKRKHDFYRDLRFWYGTARRPFREFDRSDSQDFRTALLSAFGAFGMPGFGHPVRMIFEQSGSNPIEPSFKIDACVTSRVRYVVQIHVLNSQDRCWFGVGHSQRSLEGCEIEIRSLVSWNLPFVRWAPSLGADQNVLDVYLRTKLAFGHRVSASMNDGKTFVKQLW